MISHQQTVEELAAALQTDVKSGLMRRQAGERLLQTGENALRRKRSKSPVRRFAEQFRDVMILILIAAALVSFGVALHDGQPREFLEPALILLIVVLNAVMGFVQEGRAERALEALQELSAPRARVVREGAEEIIDASGLVPGDVIRLEAGDFVPADARLIQSAGLFSEESALTGESVPAEKDALALVEESAPLGDRRNMIFSGCSITSGTATALVTATGMQTEMGKIADLLEGAAQTRTPLQEKLARLGKYLGALALIACAVIFAVGLVSGMPLMEIFMTSVSLAVSAIPEGLPAIVTIVLSVGVQRMVRKNAIIRQLPAVETLGSASVICSDKTGTLTQNRMTLVRGYADGMGESHPIGLQEPEEVRKLLLYGTLCSNAVVTMEEGRQQQIGDPTETAIVAAALAAGMEKEELERQYPRRAEIPFDSDRKLMTTVHEADGGMHVIVKGAFDVLADRCVGGDLSAARRASEEMSAGALRVLAVAGKKINQLPERLEAQQLESGLQFYGLLGMIDPPRPEAREAVSVCRRAGIRPVMITGDHKTTASAIARELGILQEGGRAITGQELDEMSEDALSSAVGDIAVYARVSPENKIRIVRAWQNHGAVVAMTGDGVNDAPALKAADIGCAMGVTGTDVAKGAADMVLTDDNFATIVDAVREGRGIFANIKKVVGFLLGTNIGEVLAVFVAMLLWRKTPLLSMQLLWVNLLTDSLPAVALGMERVEDDIMDRRPRPKEEGIFAHGFGLQVVLQGAMFAILTLAGFVIGQQGAAEIAGGRTLAFFVLALSQILQAYNVRSARSLFAIGPFGNRMLNLSVLVSLALIALVAFTPVSAAFGMVILPAQYYGVGLALAAVPIGVMELAKAIGRMRAR